MKQRQKPLSFSLHPDNHAYIEAVVAKQKETNHRYNRSMYMDDLITHLRTKAKPKAELAVIEKPVKSKRFNKPTPVDIAEYMDEKAGLGIKAMGEANSFYDFYESKGWLVGRNKMKCWKSAVRNWLKGYLKDTVDKDILQNSSDSDWHKQDQGF